jgi:hypothetical protein
MAGLRESSYVTVDDPRDFYHNVVVVLDRARDVNNGQPSALRAARTCHAAPRNTTSAKIPSVIVLRTLCFIDFSRDS